jgi:hypothetical protein
VNWGADNDKSRSPSGMTTRKAKAKCKSNGNSDCDCDCGCGLDGSGWEDVFPGWVGALDEFDLLRACPSLEFFFAGDCVANVAEVFAVDEAVNVVVGGVGTRG